MADIERYSRLDFEEFFNYIYKFEMDNTHEFNLMLVGLKGAGKSSLVRSLFRGMIKPEEVDGGPQINEYSEIIDEYGCKLRLRCIETSNFREHDPELYIEYIEQKLQGYLVAQQRQSKKYVEDSRVHCCLYLIPPYGKMQLEDVDIDCMKALHERVNLIPIITRSECYNATQRAKFKENVLADLKRHGINYFMFTYDEKEDEDRARVVTQEASRFPFAVVAADGPDSESKRWILETGSCKIDIDDSKYDFNALQMLLVRHCMINLIESTHKLHYPRFRSELLEAHKAGSKILEEIGLEPHEILRIEPSSRRLSWKQLRCELEDKAKKLRSKLKEIQVKEKETRANAQQQSNLSKTIRPPVLYEKPEFLRTNTYRRN